jgi:hypothetical protein
MAQREGGRGLPGGSSLARLLEKGRRIGDRRRRHRLTIKQILAWADLHCQRTGQWPRHDSGPVLDAPGERWTAIQAALEQGKRGLRVQSSLFKVRRPYRRLGGRTSRPWSAEEDRLVRTLPPIEAARRTGRTTGAVYSRRWLLGVPDGQTVAPASEPSG